MFLAQVDNEDLVFTLEAMVDKFGEAIAPYAVQMAQQLAGAFYKWVAGGGGNRKTSEAYLAPVYRRVPGTRRGGGRLVQVGGGRGHAFGCVHRGDIGAGRAAVNNYSA